MSAASIVVDGTVKPDGTLELDQLVKLPAGRVRITIQPVPERTQGQDWWQNLQAARAVLERRGTGFRSQDAIEAEREDFRSGDERIEAVYRAIEAERRRLEPKEC
jgi:hypothetical protein